MHRDPPAARHSARRLAAPQRAASPPERMPRLPCLPQAGRGAAQAAGRCPSGGAGAGTEVERAGRRGPGRRVGGRGACRRARWARGRAHLLAGHRHGSEARGGRAGGRRWRGGHHHAWRRSRSGSAAAGTSLAVALRGPAGDGGHGGGVTRPGASHTPHRRAGGASRAENPGERRGTRPGRIAAPAGAQRRPAGSLTGQARTPTGSEGQARAGTAARPRRTGNHPAAPGADPFRPRRRQLR